MRYSEGHKQETRERVVKVAARALRAKGPDRLGVAEVMAQAGLTHGGFYAHFKSKDDLLAAAVEEAFRQGRNLWLRSTEERPGIEGLARYIENYVSEAHRDRIDTGCPIAALGAEFARTETEAGRIFAQNLDRLLGVIAERVPGETEASRKGLAASVFAEMMGSVLLSRALSDRQASNQILAAARDSLKARIGA